MTFDGKLPDKIKALKIMYVYPSKGVTLTHCSSLQNVVSVEVSVTGLTIITRRKSSIKIIGWLKNRLESEMCEWMMVVKSVMMFCYTST